MEISLKIESSINKLNDVEYFLDTIFEKYNIDKRLYGNILLSLNEAVNNAIQHGNNFNINKFVTITFSQHKEFYEFIICDEGNGFLIDNIKDPTANENIRNESGRGIFIMKKFSDKIDIDGPQISLKFKKYRD